MGCAGCPCGGGYWPLAGPGAAPESTPKSKASSSISMDPEVHFNSDNTLKSLWPRCRCARATVHVPIFRSFMKCWSFTVTWRHEVAGLSTLKDRVWSQTGFRQFLITFVFCFCPSSSRTTYGSLLPKISTSSRFVPRTTRTFNLPIVCHTDEDSAKKSKDDVPFLIDQNVALHNAFDTLYSSSQHHSNHAHGSPLLSMRLLLSRYQAFYSTKLATRVSILFEAACKAYECVLSNSPS